MAGDARQRPDLTDLSRDEIARFVVGLGEPRYRGQQIFRWIWHRGAVSFRGMSDLPSALRERLEGAATLGSLTVERADRSVDGTRKLLVRLPDGQAVESVIIPEERRTTLCISTQVGCALGCAFCATGLMGLERNLRPGEIAGQVVAAMGELAREPLAQATGRLRPITNIVLMGMGEPLHNFDNTLRALRILSDDTGLAYSPRRITLSTVGLVPEMLDLGTKIPVKLAVSLHAADNETRGRLMPINRKYSLEALLDACRRFPRPARNRITFEYVLLADVNDRLADADRLAKLLHGLACKVNLLPFNEHPGTVFRRPDDAAVASFADRLRSHGVAATVRTTRGRDIAAACGQLLLGPPRRKTERSA